MGTYSQVYQRSIEDPAPFWLDAARAVDWTRPPSTAFETDGDRTNWFPDGELNLCINALDRHVEAGRGNQAALIYHSAITGTRRTYTYSELLERVASFAGALRDLGVETGDRVLIYLPMIPEAAVAMLACARIGATHTVVFGGFAASELAVRIKDATPKVVLTCSGGLEPNRTVEYLPTIAAALNQAPDVVEHVVVLDRPEVPGSAQTAGESYPGVSWLDWAELESAAQPADPVPVPSTHPLYILHTSGTTGRPKGVVRDTGGYAVALAWSVPNIYDITPGRTMFTASDVGWVVGHSYIVYGPLIAGATSVLYEGKPVGTPDAGEFWRVVAEHNVRTMFTAPTALRAIRRVDPELEELDAVAECVRSASARSANDDAGTGAGEPAVGRGKLPSLAALFVAGERLDPQTWHWAHDGLGVDVIDHWWQTETGWPICSIPLGIEHLESIPGSSGVPMPGFDVRILDGAGTDVTGSGPDGSSPEGNIALRLPLPPGTLTGIWGDPQRMTDSYLTAFEGHYATGDAGYIDADGYVFVMGRTDDVINVAGHRLSTGALEEVIATHEAVAECAVIGVADELKGQRAVAFVTFRSGAVDVDKTQVETELIALVREHIGPVAAFRNVTILERLPKTRSGKILRRTMRQIFDGEEHQVPATIEDPAALDEMIDVVRGGSGEHSRP